MLSDATTHPRQVDVAPCCGRDAMLVQACGWRVRSWCRAGPGSWRWAQKVSA